MEIFNWLIERGFIKDEINSWKSPRENKMNYLSYRKDYIRFDFQINWDVEFKDNVSFALRIVNFKDEIKYDGIPPIGAKTLFYFEKAITKKFFNEICDYIII